MLKKIIATICIMAAGAAHADFRFIVPQEPGGGTSVWATLVARHLEKKLGEKIVIEHIPGARDIPGANRFQNELRFDNKTVMVAHGGNAESYLLERVDYNYRDWEPIGLMNLTIAVGHRRDSDPFRGVRFAAGSGNNPDAMAIIMLICGPQPDLAAYQRCYNERFKFVKGMKANERRLAYMRGELNVQRETPAAYNRYLEVMPENQLWFSHGVLDLRTGRIQEDANFPGAGSFQSVYRKRWGRDPEGPLYDSYLLVKQYRDVLQKSLWVNKGNPNAERLRQALTAMLSDREAMKDLEEDTGRYGWLIGADVNRAFVALDRITTEKALTDLVWWSREVFGVEAVYKPNLVRKQ